MKNIMNKDLTFTNIFNKLVSKIFEFSFNAEFTIYEFVAFKQMIYNNLENEILRKEKCLKQFRKYF